MEIIRNIEIKTHIDLYSKEIEKLKKVATERYIKFFGKEERTRGELNFDNCILDVDEMYFEAEKLHISGILTSDSKEIGSLCFNILLPLGVQLDIVKSTTSKLNKIKTVLEATKKA